MWYLFDQRKEPLSLAQDMNCRYFADSARVPERRTKVQGLLGN